MTVRGYCQLYRRQLPDRFPVHPRGDMAAYRPPVVARRDGEEMVCDCLHDGVHIWPNGDHSRPGEIVLEPRRTDLS